MSVGVMSINKIHHNTCADMAVPRLGHIIIKS